MRGTSLSVATLGGDMGSGLSLDGGMGSDPAISRQMLSQPGMASALKARSMELGPTHGLSQLGAPMRFSTTPGPEAIALDPTTVIATASATTNTTTTKAAADSCTAATEAAAPFNEQF